MFSMRFALKLYVWKANETFWRVLWGHVLLACVLFSWKARLAGTPKFLLSAAI